MRKSGAAWFDVKAGAQLPHTIEVALIPQQSIANVPAVAGFAYFISDYSEMIVDPQRHINVDVIQ